MAPSTLGQFRIESRLGLGRFNETFHAYDLVRRRLVALKLLVPGLLPTDKAYRELLSIAQRASDLVHPRIAWVWETGSAEGRYYITERFIAGESLTAYLKRSGPLPWDRILQILEHIAQAIEFAEEHGWSHGRITPNNILLGGEQGAVLTDYGLSQAVRAIMPVEPPQLDLASYFAPETIKEGFVTPRSDQYMLACVLVEMATGKPPFPANDLEEINAVKAAAFDMSALPLEVFPLGVSEVVERALHPEPAMRFDTALNFVQALQHSTTIGLRDPMARARYQEQIHRQHIADELARQEAEEAARQAALEQARREIQERARLEAERAVQQAADRTRVDAQIHPISHRRSSPPHRYQWLRLLVIIGALVILSAAGFWLNSRISSPKAILPSASPTIEALFEPFTPTSLLAASPTATSSATAPPTFTPRPTASPSRTPSPSDTPSPTASFTSPPTRTATRVKPDRD